MKNLLDFDQKELIAAVKEAGLPIFRAKQLYHWLHKRLIFDFNEMTDLSKELRAQLQGMFYIGLPKVKQVLKAKDGTRKFVYQLDDGPLIETVLIQDATDRKTVCLSTQAGCPLKCGFCATGSSGFKRNLKVSEIIGQLYGISRDVPDISNLVFMGMGEPFLNYDNVMKALRMLTAKEGPNFGQRKITISTAGIPEGIKRFADENLQVRLAISLNASDDKTRGKIMPVNRKYPLDQLIPAVNYYIKKTGRRVTFEYIMLKGINDRRQDLESLKQFFTTISANINIIPFNAFGHTYQPSPPETIKFFIKALCAEGISAVERSSKGEDILAACGQLALLS
ncbi:MAG: 23S rRNA (adenine(2503)-C(2))-methyltransferase RlmN [Candidatus Margulisiibacteriota bacterium]